jgi:hypothetical protein
VGNGGFLQSASAKKFGIPELQNCAAQQLFIAVLIDNGSSILYGLIESR